MYKTVLIGAPPAQEFFAENLNYGTMISGDLGSNQADDDKVEKYCYDNLPENCEKYGALYQWAEGMAFKFVCNANLTGSVLCPQTLTPPPRLMMRARGSIKACALPIGM